MNSQKSDNNHCSQRNLNTYYTAGVHHFNLRSVPSSFWATIISVIIQQIISVVSHYSPVTPNLRFRLETAINCCSLMSVTKARSSK